MASHDPRAALAHLLADIFDGPELRRFIAGTEEKLDRDLKGASHNELAYSAADLLYRKGLVKEDLFAALRTQRPRRAADIDAVHDLFTTRLLQPVGPDSPPPVHSHRFRKRVSLVIARLLVALLVGAAVWKLLPCDSETRVADIPVLVLLFHDAPELGVPTASDIPALRSFLGTVLLPRLVLSHATAILLDFSFSAPSNSSANGTPSVPPTHTLTSDALVDLGEGLRQARAAGIPVAAVQPRGAAVAFPACTGSTTAETPCFHSFADAFIPSVCAGPGPHAGTQAILKWPFCSDGTPSLAYLAAWYSLYEDEAAVPQGVACPTIPQILSPIPADPCQRHFQRMWISELLTGEPWRGIDPATGSPVSPCPALPDPEGKVVLIGDARWVEGAGADTLFLATDGADGFTLVSGPEATAFAAAHMRSQSRTEVREKP